MEDLESGVSHLMAGHSPLGPFRVLGSCASEFHQSYRRIGKFGGEMELLACRVRWMGVGR